MNSPVLLKGSCHCGRVKYSVESHCPYPFMICHCQACTKMLGFYGNTISADYKTFKVDGMEHVKIYQAVIEKVEQHGKTPEDGLSPGKRHFCGFCGSALWIHDPRWAEFVYPSSTSIDTPLPTVPYEEQYHIFLDFKKPHVVVPEASKKFNRYPDISLKAWHENKQKQLDAAKK